MPSLKERAQAPFTVDLRSLAVFRIGLGLSILADLATLRPTFTLAELTVDPESGLASWKSALLTGSIVSDRLDRRQMRSTAMGPPIVTWGRCYCERASLCPKERTCMAIPVGRKGLTSDRKLVRVRPYPSP